MNSDTEILTLIFIMHKEDRKVQRACSFLVPLATAAPCIECSSCLSSKPLWQVPVVFFITWSVNIYMPLYVLFSAPEFRRDKLMNHLSASKWRSPLKLNNVGCSCLCAAISIDRNETKGEEKSNFIEWNQAGLSQERFIRLIGLYRGLWLMVLVLRATNRSIHCKLLLVTVIRSVDSGCWREGKWDVEQNGIYCVDLLEKPPHI